jgi:hypothetical protein
MSTLEFIGNPNTYELRSDKPHPHRKVEVLRPLSPHVYLARLGICGGVFTHTIAVKIAHNEKELENMATEAKFYDELEPLQGSVVPRVFGFFKGDIDGVKFGCLLMEYCSGPPKIDSHEWK